MKDFNKIAQEIAGEYHNYPGLIGILWIGSSAFGINDQETDIDIRFLVDRREKLNPMKQFTKNSIQIEVDEMDWNWLTQNLEPDSDQRWIREKSMILFDPQNKITEKFKQLFTQVNKIDKDKLFRFFQNCFYSNEVDKCLKRQDAVTTSLYFAKAIDSIFKFIFLYHNQPVPPFKWRWHFLTNEKLLSPETIKQFQGIILGSKPANNKLKILMVIENQLKQLMLKKGCRREMVEKPWWF